MKNYKEKFKIMSLVVWLGTGFYAWPVGASDWSVMVQTGNRAGEATATAGPQGVWTSTSLGNGMRAGTIVMGEQDLLWSSQGGNGSQHQKMTAGTVGIWKGSGEAMIMTSGGGRQEAAGSGVESYRQHIAAQSEAGGPSSPEGRQVTGGQVIQGGGSGVIQANNMVATEAGEERGNFDWLAVLVKALGAWGIFR